jgi:hypothetical protein
MKRNPQRITHPSELSALSTLPWQRMPGRGRIVIDDTNVAEPVRTKWEQQLNRLYFACGCDSAAIGLTVGIVGYAAWILLRPGGWAFGVYDALVGIGVAVGVALVGKLSGRVRADLRLKQRVREIQSEWKPPRMEGEARSCG